MSPIHVADSVRIALGTDGDCQALADALGQTALPTKMCDTVQELVERYKLIYKLRRFIFEQSQNIPSDKPIAMPNSLKELSSESCGARQQRWNEAILSGNEKLANQIATELWALGARGTDVAFKSKMLGIPSPPASQNP